LRGLTDAERAYLRSFLLDPAFPAFERLARAPAFAAITPGSINDSTVPWDVPIPKFGKTREAAYRKLAQAALAIDAKQYAAAEMSLRELIGVGIVMSDNAVMLIEALIGAVIGNIAMEPLATLYDATGRPNDAERIREASSIRAAAEDEIRMPAEALPPDRTLSNFRRIATDSSRLRALRWEAMYALFPLNTCQDLRGLLLGMSPEIRRDLEHARISLVRTPDEELFYKALSEQVDRYYDRDESVYRGRTQKGHRALVRQATRIVGRLTGNERLYYCYVVAPEVY
jgi:hypothetical protein